MSKNNNQPQRSTPQQIVADAEHTIVELERKQAALNKQREADDAERSRIAFAAHAQSDAEASKQLAALTEQALRRDREAGDIIAALTTARLKLNEAQALLARDERKAQIKELQERSRQFREIGPYLDKATDNLRRGLIALKENASIVGRDFRHVQMLHRVLSVALFDTPFRDAFGVPDANDRRSFATFSGVVNAWCDSNDAALKRELEALDGVSQQTDEAA